MSNRKKYAALVVGVCVVAATFFLSRQGGAAAQVDTDLKPTAVAGWPTDQTWSWSFQLPSDIGNGDGISLRLRSKSFTLRTHESLAISSQTSAMLAADAENELIAGSILPRTGPTPQPVSGGAVIQ